MYCEFAIYLQNHNIWIFKVRNLMNGLELHIMVVGSLGSNSCMIRARGCIGRRNNWAGFVFWTCTYYILVKQWPIDAPPLSMQNNSLTPKSTQTRLVGRKPQSVNPVESDVDFLLALIRPGHSPSHWSAKKSARWAKRIEKSCAYKLRSFAIEGPTFALLRI